MKQTPKEKAKELVNQFAAIDNDIFCSVNYPYSKQCALIAVAEILSILFQHHEIDYFKEVKQEIEKL